MTFEFTVPGAPRGKERPRLGKNGVYTPEKTKNYEDLVRRYFRIAYPKASPITGSVRVTIVAWFSPPKNITKARAAEIKAGATKPTVKPGWDNVGKIITGALNGFAYVDDKQVFDGRVIKEYELFGEPRVEVYIEEVV